MWPSSGKGEMMASGSFILITDGLPGRGVTASDTGSDAAAASKLLSRLR